jgi:IBR domain, a half RING-finger domain
MSSMNLYKVSKCLLQTWSPGSPSEHDSDSGTPFHVYIQKGMVQVQVPFRTVSPYTHVVHSFSALIHTGDVSSVPRDCIICTQPIQGREIRVPCGHYYDVECIISLFHASTKDESLFPPRCCKKSIPLSRVQDHFSASLLRQFVEKAREFSTPKRVYCARPQCSQFLGPQTEGKAPANAKAYTCTCGTVMCSRCKNVRDDGVQHLCGDGVDEGTQVVLALGKTNGWARCPGCRTMIELNLGCYHMTCLCKVRVSPRHFLESSLNFQPPG